MQFSNEIRHAINAELIRQSDTLIYPSLNFLTHNFENYSRVCVEKMCLNLTSPGLDLDVCVNFMLDSKKDIGDTVFENKISSNRQWGNNDVLFPFTNRFPMITEWGTDLFWKYTNWRNELEYTCEREFYKNEQNLAAYAIFSDLNIYDNKVFKQGDPISNIRKSRFFFNKKNWFNYVHALIEKHFPEFKYNKQFSNKKMKRFLMEIHPGIWFGFEYDESEMLYELNKGSTVLPDFFNLILLNSSFNRDENVLNYYYDHHPHAISLGILGNPYFYPPCYPLLGYSAVDYHRASETNEGYFIKIERLDDERLQIKYPIEYARSMKRHAFFYMSLLSQTSVIYTDYLKAVISTVFNNHLSDL